MSNLALRVEHPCPEHFDYAQCKLRRRISKLCHIGKAQKRHDTLRDAIGDSRLEIRD